MNRQTTCDRPAPALSPGLRVGRGDQRVPDRGRGARGWQGPVHLGRVLPRARRYRRWQQRRRRVRSLSPAGVRSRPDRGSRRARVSLLDFLAARAADRAAGAINAGGLAFYERLVDGLLARNIQPYATLYHWDLPAELQRRDGGWLARDTADRFADYARIVARRLGDRIVSFATHNEPWVTAVLGYERGVFAPGIKDRRVAYQVSHHLLVSHGLARAGDSRRRAARLKWASC